MNISTLKIQVIFQGHLRGHENIESYVNFFKNIDVNIINSKLNTSYKDIQFYFYLHTVPEINLKQMILEYGKKIYPDRYKEYTLDDFYFWLDKFKENFNFEKIILDNPDELKKETDDIYKKYININDTLLKERIEIFKKDVGHAYTKYQRMASIIRDDVDIVFKLRPDLIFYYDYNDINQKIEMNNNFIKFLNKPIDKINKTVYTSWTACTDGYTDADSIYHMATPICMKTFLKDIQYNNLELKKEYDNLNGDIFPILKNFLKNFSYDVRVERTQFINCNLHSLDMDTLFFRLQFLYLVAPYHLNKSGIVNWSTIHVDFANNYFNK